MLHQGLHEVEPGKRIGEIRFRAAGYVAVRDFREGIMPSKEGFDDHVHAFVATGDPYNGYHGDLAVVVETNEDTGEALLDIEPRVHRAERNVRLIRETVTMSLNESGVQVGLLDPATASVKPEVLEQIGFIPEDSGLLKFVAPMAA
jgi:hypothetical protein